MAALLVFIMATMEIVFGQKKLNCRTQKGLFGGKALKSTVQIDPRLMPLKNSSEWHSETVLLN